MFHSSNDINSPRLLIAEDDPHVMFFLREFFCDQGYLVDCVAGPGEAVEMLKRFSYKVLLADVHLTKHRRAEGFTVLQQARLAQPAIRTILMTGFPSDQLESTAQELGADVVLSKPLGVNLLSDAVAECLRSLRPATSS